VDVLYWVFTGVGAAQVAVWAWLNIRHQQGHARKLTQVVQADARIIFPACARMNARRIAEEWPGTVSFICREANQGWAWYAVRSTASGESVTLAGWCRTMRGCDRVRGRLRGDAAADARRFSVRLPAA
jgi:hypothetical protein